jgi:hypothetical protein
MRIVPGQILGLSWTRAVLRAALSLAVCPGLLWSGVVAAQAWLLAERLAAEAPAQGVACFAGLPALPETQ